MLQQNLLGDVVLSTGIIRALREDFPQSKIGFLVPPGPAPLVRLPFIDELIVYTKGMPLRPVISQISKYDVAICLDFKYRSALLPFLAGIPVIAGIAHKRKLLMTNPVPRPEDSEQMYFTRYMAKVIRQSLGLEFKADITRLCVAEASEADRLQVQGLLANLPEATTKICIAPFSSTAAKDWPADCYAELLERLRQIGKFSFVIVGTPGDKSKYFPVDAPDVLDLRGATSVAQMPEVMRHLDYFIGSCSAPLHIAAAVDLPKVAFYGPTSPLKWAPVHDCTVLFHEQQCSPCDRIGYGAPCAGNNVCMQSITVDEAYSAVCTMLNIRS